VPLAVSAVVHRTQSPSSKAVTLSDKDGLRGVKEVTTVREGDNDDGKPFIVYYLVTNGFRGLVFSHIYTNTMVMFSAGDGVGGRNVF
jgi:hypothetical protein